jgi:hypothetical protein
MKRFHFQRISFGALVLSCASWITAAIIPLDPEPDSKDAQGSITNSEDNGNGTCTLTDEIGTPCYNTASGLREMSGTTRCKNSSNQTSLDNSVIPSIG